MGPKVSWTGFVCPAPKDALPAPVHPGSSGWAFLPSALASHSAFAPLAASVTL